jgi:hypothetical protein
MMVNYFNFLQGDEVTAKILVAHEKPENFGKNYMVDVNNVIASANIPITRKQNVLGLIANVHGENRFCFANVSIGNSITARRGDQSTHTRKYLISRFIHTLDFREILSTAGANVVATRPDGDYLDLSPEALDKTTIINLIKPNA